ncbi:hypothetical protein PHAMO_290110 [Magnetospirillum molischianum DSM 120]|uniref:Uncharacterized protein n=2 Tax=Magnetospirillum molischianum TaxID=1083 RepID=H8FTW5_MAGML|nr:hypothetical protein PHAMO_290110 [Magnetospirillum molischianum DSM 120]
MPLKGLKRETRAMSSLDRAAATTRGEPMTESYPPSDLDALTLRENAERAAYQIRLADYQARCGEASADPLPRLPGNVVRLNDFRAPKIGD